MTTENQSGGRLTKWKKILIHEFFEYWFNFFFLAFFLVSFAWYKRLILAEYQIEYAGYWAPLIEAAVLAKVVMIGDALRVGRRFRNLPLVVPTIYRTIAFSLLVILFAFAEHIVRALVHGKTVSAGIAEVTNKGWPVILAWFVVIIAAFLPFFTVKEIEAAFGQSKVREMFFHKHHEETGPSNDDPGKAARHQP